MLFLIGCTVIIAVVNCDGQITDLGKTRKTTGFV